MRENNQNPFSFTKVFISEKLIRYMIFCILSGLDFLHQSNIVYNNDSRKSIQINWNGKIKLAGFSRSYQSAQIYPDLDTFKYMKCSHYYKHRGGWNDLYNLFRNIILTVEDVFYKTFVDYTLDGLKYLVGYAEEDGNIDKLLDDFARSLSFIDASPKWEYYSIELRGFMKKCLPSSCKASDLLNLPIFSVYDSNGEVNATNELQEVNCVIKYGL